MLVDRRDEETIRAVDEVVTDRFERAHRATLVPVVS